MGQDLSKEKTELRAFANSLYEEVKRTMTKHQKETDAVLREQTKNINQLFDEVAALKEEAREATERLARVEELLANEVEALREEAAIMEGRTSRAEKQISDMKEQLLLAEARTMQDNLVFYNIPEREEEDTARVLQGFLSDELHLSEHDMKRIDIDAVHRVGPRVADKTRVIVAKFTPSSAKEKVLDHAQFLKKEYAVCEHLPRELEERRRQLLPRYNAAVKQSKDDVSWSLDKLVVGDKVTQVRRDVTSDLHLNTTQVAKTIPVDRTPEFPYNDGGFLGHYVDISSQDDALPTLHAIYADLRAAKANHNIYAYRILRDGELIEHYEDDGEWGAGRLLLRLLRDYKMNNGFLCVSHWYKTNNLGRARYQHIMEVGDVALLPRTST